MKCHFCSDPATVHITDMSKGKYRELHLCRRCAEKERSGELAAAEPAQGELSDQQVDVVKAVIAAFAGELAGELAKLACPHCGTKYMEFRANGRLGCPGDYEAFRKGILPLLERVHGSTRHKGKTPRRGSGASSPHVELIRLRRELAAAVDREDYEQAARLRDQLRAKEVPHEPR